MMYEGGLGWMRHSISDTAEYGDYSRGPRIVTEATRAEMKRILREVQTGAFAREWILAQLLEVGPSGLVLEDPLAVPQRPIVGQRLDHDAPRARARPRVPRAPPRR